MTRKFALILATTTVCGALPQIAYASCSGNACSAYLFAGNKFTNKDKDRQIHLMGCFIKSGGTCGSPPVNFDIIVDPNSSKPITVPASVGSDVKVDVKTAAFVGSPPQPHAQTPPGAAPAPTVTGIPRLNLEDTRKKRDQARADLGKAYDDHKSCVRAASLNPIKLTVVDPCLASQQKIDALNAEISKDDKILGETEPGAPIRTDKPLDTTPVPPGKPAKPPAAVVQETLHLPCPPGAPEDPKDSKGDKSGVFNGKAGGLNCTTNVGGGKK